MSATHWTWLLIAVATSAVIFRPWRLPETVWAVAGAQAWAGVRRGDDVYLFLAWMLLLSELARREGVSVGSWQFLKLGALVMPPALLAALGTLQLVQWLLGWVSLLYFL